MKTKIMTWLLATTTLASCFTDTIGTGNDGGHGSDTATSDVVGEGVEIPFARACARLHGECAAVCDNVFFVCYESVSTCTREWTADHLQDYAFPVVDEDLVAKCAKQVDRQPCTDLRPDTIECDYAVVESCPDDADDYGAPYSPLSAHPVQIGDRLDLDLCDNVDEFFSVHVEAGTALEIVHEDDGPRLYRDMMRLQTNASGDTVIEWVGIENPVPVTGEYVLVVSASARSHRQLRVVVHDDGD